MHGNSFTERYKSLNNDYLLDIIDNASDYQPQAVEAAKTELDNRNLTSAQLEEAKAEQEIRQEDKANRQEKAKAIKEKIKSAGSSLVDTFNPIQKDAHVADRYIKLVSILLAAIFGYSLYKEFSLLKFMMTSKNNNWDLASVLYFFPLIVAPVASILFWFRKKIGWIVTAVFLSYNVISAIIAFAISVEFDLKFDRDYGGTSPLENIIPHPSTTSYLFGSIFFGGVLIIISKKEIREIYSIDIRTLYITTILTSLFTLLIVLGVINQ